jgi:hypothetical protein
MKRSRDHWLRVTTWKQPLLVFFFLATPDSAGTRVQDWRPRDVSCLRAPSCMLHEAGGTDIEEVGCKCGPQLLHQWSVWGSAGQGCLVGFSGVQHV